VNRVQGESSPSGRPVGPGVYTGVLPLALAAGLLLGGCAPNGEPGGDEAASPLDGGGAVDAAAIMDAAALGAGQSGEGGIELLRTPEDRFEDLPDYDFQPRYVFVDDPEGPPGNRRIRVHHAVSGPPGAPTLLMMHGNPSWSFLFRKLVPEINAAGYRTLFFDYVGHGRSDKPIQEEDYTYDRHLEWIRQVFAQLDADPELGLDRVVLFGHDYGHPLGARLQAEHYPDRFDGFINGNAGLNRGRYGLSSRHEQWRAFVRAVEPVPIGAIVCRNEARREQGVLPCPPAVEAGYDAPYPSANYQASIRAFPEMVPEDTSSPEARANQRAWDYLQTYERPYLVIWESSDKPDFLPPNRRDEYISSIPGAYGLRHPQFRTGHYSPEDAPRQVAEVIIEFLDDIYEPRAFEQRIFTDFTSGLRPFSCSEEGCRHDDRTKAIALSDSGSAVLGETTSLDLSGAVELKVVFRFRPELDPDPDPKDQLFVELWSGEAWVRLGAFRRGAERGEGDFSNHSTDYAYVRVGRDEVDFGSGTKVRIHFQGSGAPGEILIRDFGIFARTP
jgi:haloalkane dehalogenase